MSSTNISENNIKMSAALKTTKSSTKTTKKAIEEPIAAVAVAVAPAAAKGKKAAAVAAAPVAPAPVAVAEPSTPATLSTPVTEENVAVTLMKTISELQDQVSGLRSTLSTMAAGLKTVEKQAGRLAKKVGRRRRNKVAEAGAEPKPCIFTKPVKVTDELCSFLGNAKGTEVSRAAVTKGVMAYARSHNLLDKQTINADAPLRKLLTLAEGDVLTILNLQKFLRRHYVKAPVAAV
jgi:hypothetical protein